LLDRLAALVVWTALRQSPAQWAAVMRALRGLVRAPAFSDGVSHDIAMNWRSQAAALEAFDAALDETAATVADNEPIPFSEFWRAVRIVLDETEFRVADRRRNAVEVFDAAGSQPWELPVVFLCGLAETDPPAYGEAAAILPEAARSALSKAGIAVATAASRRRDEEMLFRTALGGATCELTLSRPLRDASGETVPPSRLLEKIGPRLDAARQSAGRGSRRPARRLQAGRGRLLRDERLIDVVRVQHDSLHAFAIESFIECPFRFFLEHTLGLQTPPAAPEGRLSQQMQEQIVRRALTGLDRDEKPPEAVFERVFEEVCTQRRVPAGCRTEATRLRMWRDLQRYLAEPAGLEDSTTRSGESVHLPLSDNVEVRGRIDRVDVDRERRAVVYDFRYGGQRRRTELAAPLHLLALTQMCGYTPGGLFRCELQGEVRLDGWHTQLPGLEAAGDACTPKELCERLEAARRTAERAAAEIRRGVIAAAPEERRLCASCLYFDVCRPAPERAAAEVAAL